MDCEITVDTLDAHYWNYKTNPKEQDQSWGDSIYTDFTDFNVISSAMSLTSCTALSIATPTPHNFNIPISA